ncbi:hypothetical protein L9W92_14825 [Pelotomaculum terephthalicicum JT]|uniref:hypothetical protein n=1 Tax=Pelotomaculum terephthalicicum TaxID=206393 RepID=UPI001F03FFDD|nr:hypothetical protein [Pelotomaculum terephthalicicum]MCG9969295.1 hypothetical protein [Pelotomaculum terephthalicicum JT]
MIYLLVIQLCLPYFIPANIIYDNRLNYDFVKNRTTNIDTVLEQVKIIIEKEHLKDYVVILGDSVAYSNPGPSDKSISYYLNEMAEKEERSFRVFNLAMPAMQTGDIYTMLLKMKQHGISNDHLIINIVYAGFVKRDPDPPAVYWLQQQLKSIDIDSYQKIESNLPASSNNEEKGFNVFKNIKTSINIFLYENISIFMYKDLLQLYFTEKINQIRGKIPVETKSVQPWYAKDFLPELLKQPEYRRDYADNMFEMDGNNPQIYFLNKIIELQKGKNTLIFLAAVNDELLYDDINKSGYQENLQRIDNYFKDKPVDYLNFYGKIDNKLFSDHIHLIPEGYYYLSKSLYKTINTWKIN